MPLTGNPTPLGIPNFGPNDRPALDLSPGLLDITAEIDTLLTSQQQVKRLFDQTLVASAASFDIQNIAQTCSHLKLVSYLRDDGAGTTWSFAYVLINNDNGAHYDPQLVYASGSGAPINGGVNVNQFFAYAGIEAEGASTADRFGESEISIPNYRGAHHKIVRAEGYASTSGAIAGIAHVWLGTTWTQVAAINRITILPGSGSNFVAGSRVTLYGLV